MAKYVPVKQEERKTDSPSDYGSHASMIDNEETEKLEDDKLVALRDSVGVYVTKRDRLDTGLADPNRYQNRIIKS